MVRSLHKTKILFAVAFSLITPAFIMSFAHAENLDFQVNVAEVLTISVTEPSNWAVGDTGDLLRNKVNVSATTNNPSGVTVSMYTDTGKTDLRNIITYDANNSATYIPTLSTGVSVKAYEFPANNWGYSVNDGDNPVSNADYFGMGDRTTPIQLFATNTAGTDDKDVFFGAKANANVHSGTYAQTVYFAAVTGTVDTNNNNPAVPTNPSTPNPTPEVAVYNPTTGNTTYTTYTTTGSGASATQTTTTEVSKGNVTSAYANPAGVTSSTSGDNSNAGLIAALATGAAISAVSGTAFFVAAKHKNGGEG